MRISPLHRVAFKEGRNAASPPARLPYRSSLMKGVPNEKYHLFMRLVTVAKDNSALFRAPLPALAGAQEMDVRSDGRMG